MTRTNLFLTIVLCVGVSLGGCARERDLRWENILATKGIDHRPLKVVIEPTAAAEEIAIADLILGLPAGWHIDSIATDNDSKDVGLTVRHGSVGLRARFRYNPWSILKDGRDDVVAWIGRYFLDPELMLEQYRSDLEFASAVYNAVPSDLRGMSGALVDKTKALLYVKTFMLDFVKSVQMRSVRLFATFYPTSRQAVADIFDDAGRQRGVVGLELLQPVDDESKIVPELLLQLLSNSRFTEDAATQKSVRE